MKVLIIGDVPIRPQPEPEPTRLDSARQAVDSILSGYTSVVTGGVNYLSVRRATLYFLVGAGVALGIMPLALLALLALALTEAVIPQ